MSKPIVSSYLNAHQYLQDLYAYFKTETPHFSYEQWSRQLDLKSRSFLRMVVVGKRNITESFIDLFSHKMNFRPDEEEYFRALVAYTQCRSHEQKKFFSKKLIDLLKTDTDRVQLENYYDFFSSPIFLRLLTLLSFEDIQKTSSQLAALLLADENKISECLIHLEKMNLAIRKIHNNAETTWEAKNRLHKIPDNFGNEALVAFHTASLKDAIKAQRKPKLERRFRSLLLPLSLEEHEEFLRDLEDFVKQTLLKFQSDQLVGRMLFQVNLNSFTVSENPMAVLKSELV